MDEFTVIGTRTRAEWEDWRVDDDRENWKTGNVVITDEGVELAETFTATYVTPTTIEGGALGDPVDVDVDCRETLYALGADGALYRALGAGGAFGRLSCDSLGVDVDVTPTAFCATDETFYVVGRTESGGDSSGPVDGARSEPDRDRRGYVQGLSARLRQTRWVLEAADGVAFCDPIRAVRGSGGECYVLDRGPTEGEGFVARVTASGAASVVVDGLRRPRDLTVDDRGELTVLDVDAETGDGAGERAVLGVRAVAPEAGVDADTERADGLMLRRVRGLPPDAACIEAVEPGEFVIGVGPDTEDERTLYRYTWGKRAVEPLSSFKQSCRTLRRGYSDDAGPRLYLINDVSDGTRTCDVFVLEPVDTVVRGPTGYRGWINTWFDLGEIRAASYRIGLSTGDLPPGTRVELRYATTDQDITPAGPIDEDADAEPDDCRNVDDEDSGPVRWVPVDESNPSDVLVESKGRRYLWLRVDLLGNQYASPTVTSVKVSLTHESYIEYLPTIYVEDGRSADEDEESPFLERFLNVFEDTFGDVDHGLETLTEYLSPDTIPAPHLSWLGSWLATAENDAWAARSKQQLIVEAPVLFKQRGTRRGLSRLLEIYLGGVDPTPIPWAATQGDGSDDGDASTDGNGGSDGETGTTGADTFFSVVEYGDVVETTRVAKTTPNGAEAGATATGRECETEPGTATETDADGTLPAPFSDLVCCPQEFVVVLAPTVGEEARGTVERLVEEERPAHTVGRTIQLSPWGRLDGHTYLGVNSYLSPEAFVVEESYLGLNSAIDGGREAQLGFGWESRLGEGLELS